MRVKVVKTGEIIDVNYIPILGQYSVKDGRLFLPQELTFHVPPTETYIDWEQRRFELAKAAMQGILSRGTYSYSYDTLAEKSICCADTVIAKLKEE